MTARLLPACALAACLALTGCGGTTSSGTTSTPTASSASPSEPSAASSPASSSPTEAASSSPAPSLTTIPDEDLPQIDGFEYSSDGIDDAALLAQMGGGSDDGPQLEGAVVRAISVDGQVGGVISMFRAADDYTATERRNAAIDAAAGFAMLKRAEKETVAGETVWRTTRKGSPPLYAMAWAYGDSVYLLATGSAKATKAAMGAVILAVRG